MKKLFALSLILCSVLGAFSGCGSSPSSEDSSVESSSCEHTYEWAQYEETHQKVYTCGCPTPDIAEMHLDTDEDYVCDICGYEMAKPASRGLEFINNNDGTNYALKSIGTCTDKDIVIPNTYEGLPVVGVLPEAFMENSTITSVVIPDNVVLIYENAGEMWWA